MTTVDDLHQLVSRFDPKARFWNSQDTGSGADHDSDWAPTANGSTGESVLGRLAQDGAWLDQQRFPQLEYAVEGLIPEGLGLVVAPPKKGKSWFVASIGLAVASGGLALGVIQVTQRPVLYLALEDGDRRLQSRFRRILGSGVPIPVGMYRIIKATPAEAITAISEFMELHAEARPLVILDTLGKVKPPKKPGEESYLADYKVGSQLKELADAVPGSCLLIVHHTRKTESADFVDTVSGTQGLAGSVDFVHVLNRKRHEDNAILSVTGRDIIEAEYALTADDGILWRLDGADLSAARDAVDQRSAEASVGDRQTVVYRTVVAADGPVTAGDIAAATGMTNDHAGQYLRRLVAAELIHKEGRGVFSLGPATRASHLDLVQDSESEQDLEELPESPCNGVSELSELSGAEQYPSSGQVNDSDRHSDSVTGVSEKTDDMSPDSFSPSDTPDKNTGMVCELATTSDQEVQDKADTSDSADTSAYNTENPSSSAENATASFQRLREQFVPQDFADRAQNNNVVHERVKGVIARRLQKVGQATRAELKQALKSKDRHEMDAVFDALVGLGHLVAAEKNLNTTRWRLVNPLPTTPITTTTTHG